MANNNGASPVLVLNCKLGGLALMRSLGKLGVPVYGVDAEKNAPGFLSRYCRGRFIHQFDENRPDDDLAFVMGIGAKFNTKAILIPTSDELAVFVANNAETLSRHFLFPANDPLLMENLISKEGMYHLALDHGVPTPATLFPKCLDEVEEYAAKVAFPVMLKGIHGNRLMARTGKKMVIVETREDLLHNYRELEDAENPNLMIQEYIPGDDDTIFIFNGYFNGESDCLAAFTGHKVRQYPVHTGCASLGKCTWVQDVADLTTHFMKAIGYRGILDIGYRYDARDGKYKVLDINPRIGQAFRLFLAQDGSDVARTLYRDLLGMEISAIVPREGRLWMIEDYDLESSLDYKRERTLSFGGWLKSFKGLEEGAWFDRNDLRPFLNMCGKLSRKAWHYAGKNLRGVKKEESGLQKV
jgi:D-aspartate ligase